MVDSPPYLGDTTMLDGWPIFARFILGGGMVALAAVLVAVGTNILKDAWDSGKTPARQAAAFDPSNRPWVDIEVRTGAPAQEMPNDKSLGIGYYSIAIKNVGAAPASNVRVFSQHYAVAEVHSWDADLSKIRAIGIEKAKIGALSEDAKFSRLPLMLPGATIPKNAYSGPLPWSSVIFVCVAYQIPGIDEDRFTCKAFDFTAQTPSTSISDPGIAT